MANPHAHVYFRDRIVPAADASVGVASSAVLYGLSDYTVFPGVGTPGVIQRMPGVRGPGPRQARMAQPGAVSANGGANG
jgi:hypothetical protein